MISDSLTKKVGSFFLRNVMVSGKWSLSDKAVQEEHNALLFLISSEKSLAGVDPDEITFICSVANVQCWPNRALGRAQEVARDVSPSTK